ACGALFCARRAGTQSLPRPRSVTLGGPRTKVDATDTKVVTAATAIATGMAAIRVAPPAIATGAATSTRTKQRQATDAVTDGVMAIATVSVMANAMSASTASTRMP